MILNLFFGNEAAKVQVLFEREIFKIPDHINIHEIFAEEVFANFEKDSKVDWKAELIESY